MAMEQTQQHVPIWFYALNLFDDMFKPIAERREAAYDRTMRKYEADTQAFNFMVMLQSMMKPYHDAQVNQIKDLNQYNIEAIYKSKNSVKGVLGTLVKDASTSDEVARELYNEQAEILVDVPGLHAKELTQTPDGGVTVKYFYGNENNTKPFADITITPITGFDGNKTYDVTYTLADDVNVKALETTARNDGNMMFGKFTATSLLVGDYKKIIKAVDNLFDGQVDAAKLKQSEDLLNVLEAQRIQLEKLQQDRKDAASRVPAGTFPTRRTK